MDTIFIELLGINPTVLCGECGKPMKLIKHKVRSFYGCTAWPACTGTHGAHPNGKPLGIPADKETKDARRQVHVLLDEFKKTFNLGKNATYKRFAQLMKLPRNACHVALFTRSTCDVACHVLADAIREHQAVRLRRQDRGSEKQELPPDHGREGNTRLVQSDG